TKNHHALGMRENILGCPSREIEPGAIREETKAGGGKLGSSLALQHGIELVLESMQMQHVGGGIAHLRVAQRLRSPIRELLLLGELDAEHLADEILEAMLVGIGAREPRSDLGAIDRHEHDAQPMRERGDIKPGKMK